MAATAWALMGSVVEVMPAKETVRVKESVEEKDNNEATCTRQTADMGASFWRPQMR